MSLGVRCVVMRYVVFYILESFYMRLLTEEMEKDAIVAHGMGQFLKERLMETSDISKAYVCDECGMFAAKVIDKEYYRCKGCHNSTRISAVVIPHACKLLFQELTAVNVLPRLRTERSIHGDEA